MTQRVIIVKAKEETFLLPADTTDILHKSALGLLKERLDRGYWYDDEWESRARDLVASGDGAGAWRFLQERSDEGYEYEGVRLQGVREEV
jgi:hypothetical protein